MNQERYIIEVTAPDSDYFNKFYKSFEGFYSTICNPEESYFHLVKKVNPLELKKNPSEIFEAIILAPTIDGKKSVKIDLKTPTRGSLQGVLTKKGFIFPAYQLVFDSLKAI
jgi:hypothetical protein